MGFLDVITGQDDGGVRPLSESQAIRLVKIAKNERDRLIFKIILNSGMSVDELLNIRYSDVNFEDSTIIIYGKKVRRIRLPASVVADIKAFVGTNFEDRLLFPMQRDNLSTILKTYQNGNGFVFDYRTLRRTYASLAAQKRIDPQIIATNIGISMQELMGFYNYYKPPVKENLKSVVD